VTGPSSGAAILEWIENQTTGQRLYFDLTINAGEVITIDLRIGVKTVTSNWRGRIASQPLRNSAEATWHIAPGANVIAVFMAGTTTGASVSASWPVTHVSADGGS
jgi:hypothetical protein